MGSNFQPTREMPFSDDLNDYSTRELMDFLRAARACGGYYNICYGNCGFSSPNYKSHSVDEIKAVLATREHIPNGPERRRIRQQAARQKTRVSNSIR